MSLHKVVRVWLLLVLFLTCIGASAQSSYRYVAGGEYFIDVDSGQGHGTPLTATDGSFDNAFEKVQASLSSLSQGMHSINIRVVDSAGNWSPVFTTIISVEAPITARSLNITAAEYFIDNDPGPGAATLMIAFDGNFSDAFEQAKDSNGISLTQGFHKIGMRVRGLDGAWSNTFITVVSAEAPITARNLKITHAEYFIDNDPGAGAGTAMLAFDGNFNNAFEQAMDSSGISLTQGFHKIGMRVQGLDGTWGNVFTTVISVESAITARNLKITHAEYFIDTDPGAGLGTAMVAFDGNFNDAFEQAVASNTSLTQGFHTIGMRVQGLDGTWGNVFTTVVSVESAITARNLKITHAEYFIDNDPGAGSGTAMIAFDGNFNDAFEQAVNSSGISLTQGFHKIGMRVQGLDGAWGNVFTTVVSAESAITARDLKITAAEYFIDNDPGQGNGTAMIAFDGNYNDAFEQAINSGGISLTQGFHKISMRVKGLDGAWGNVFSTAISAEAPVTARNLKVTQGEYFFDTDPGQGNGTAMLAFDGNFNDAFERATASYNSALLSSGFHTVSMRVRGLDGAWSNTFTMAFFVDHCTSNPTVSVSPSTLQTICPSDSVQLSAVPNTLSSYQWVQGVTVVGSGATYYAHTPGFYKVIGYDVNGCPGNSANVQVDTLASPHVSISVSGPLTFCSGGSVTLTASSGFNTYTWSNGSHAQSINVTANGIFTVTATTGSGCAAVSTPDTIIVNPNPPVPTITAGGALQFCTGGSVTLTSSAAGGNTWSTNATTPSISVSTTGSYTVTAQNAFGCSATSIATVVTVNTPTVSVTPSATQTVCSYDSVRLTAISATATSYQWKRNGSPISGAQSSTYRPLISGSYSCDIQDALGCSASSNSVTVNMVTAPTVSISSGSSTSFCNGDSAVLTAVTSATSFTWSTGVHTSFITTRSTATYGVTVTDGNGCTASATPVHISAGNPLNSFAVDSGVRFIPSAPTAHFSASTNGTIISYHWNFGDGTTSSSSTPAHTFTSASAPGFYNVGLTVVDSNGCSASDSITNYIQVWDVFPHANTTFGSIDSNDVVAESFVSPTHGDILMNDGRMYQTIDGGMTWTVVMLPCTCHVHSIHYVGRTGGGTTTVIPGGGPPNAGSLLIDTGTGLIHHDVPCSCDINDYIIPDPNQPGGYGMGTGGNVWYWNGSGWVNTNYPGGNTINAGYYWGGYLYVVGSGGYLYRYDPYLNLWYPLFSGFGGGDIYGIGFGSGSGGGGGGGGGSGGGGGGGGGGAGYAVGPGGISISNDGGSTWHHVPISLPYDLTAVHVIDSTHAICVGDHGIVYVTPDCGLTWTPYSIGDTTDLTSVTANGCKGYVAGVNGQVYTFNVSYNPAAPVFTSLLDSLCSGSTTVLSVTSPKIGSTYIWSNGHVGTTDTISLGGSYYVTEYSACDTLTSLPHTITLLTLRTYYADADHDGYGNASVSINACSAPVGYVTDHSDCDDADSLIHAPILYYVDADHDGYGSTVTASLCSRTAPLGYSTNNTDCNDNDPLIHAPIAYFVDYDRDGYGSSTVVMLCASNAPAGYATNSLDCNDSNAVIHPHAIDICGNGIDEDCSGSDSVCGINTIVWNGSVSTAWNTAANWTPSIVPDSIAFSVIIPNKVRKPVTSTNVSVLNLQIDSGATLTCNGSVSVYGSWTGSSSLPVQVLGSQNVILKGNAQIQGYTSFNYLEIGGSYTIGSGGNDKIAVRSILKKKAGVLNTNGRLTLISTPTQTALIADSGGSLSGTALVQRYMPGALGYHHISSPLTGALVGNLSGFSITGVDGDPGYVGHAGTLDIYREPINNSGKLDSGYYNYISASRPLTSGMGLTALIQGGTTIGFTGAPAAGNINYTITNLGTNARTAGWNLVGNPYPSPIRWSAIKAANAGAMNATCYIWKPSSASAGTWVAYNGTYGTGGVGDLIGLGQGFMILKTNPGSSALSFNNTMRTTDLSPVFYKSDVAPDEIRLTMTDGDNTAEILAYTEEGRTAGFDEDADGLLPPDVSGMNGNSIAFVSQDQNYLIHVLDHLSETMEIPLAIHTSTAGTYTISAASLNVNQYPVYLLDKATNTYHEIAAKDVTFSSTGEEDKTNYSIVFSKKATASSPGEIKVNIWSTAGAINIERSSNAEPATIIVTDLLGREIIRTSTTGSFVSLPVDVSAVYLVREQEGGRETVRKVFVR